jgi:O-antigen/teichoic acid export membrane protein
MELIRRYIGTTWIGPIINSPKLQQYLQNVSWLIFEKTFSLFVALLVNIYVARYLQPVNYGLLNYAISFVGIFSSFTSLGLDQILIRELSKYPERTRQILGTGFLLKLLGSLCLGLIIIVALPFMNNGELTNVLILIIASAEIFKSFDVINCYYQSRVQSKYIAQVQIAINLLSSFIKVALVYFGAPIMWFAWILFFNAVTNALGYLFNYYKRDGSIFIWLYEKSYAGRLLRESWPLAIHGLALLTQARIDQVMIGKMINVAEVGQYSVALRLIEVFSFVPIVLLSTFMPVITRAREVSNALYEDRLINLYRLMFFMFIVVALPIFIFAKQIIILLYGIEYEPAGVLLSLFAIRLFFTNMGVAKSVYTVNESLFKYSLLATTIGAVVNITVNYFMIPIYGSKGAIIATVISFAMSDFVVDLLYKKTRHNQGLIFRAIFSFWKIGKVFEKV